MSCGNRFQCGLKKPSRFQFQPDKPSNPELHNENQQRLNNLLKSREEIDKLFFPNNTQIVDTNSSNINSSNTNSSNTNSSNTNSSNTNIIVNNYNINDNNNFTPWKIPSATDYQSKFK
jgi:hypothetical protein